MAGDMGPLRGTMRRQGRSDVAAVEGVARTGRKDTGRVPIPQLDLVLI